MNMQLLRAINCLLHAINGGTSGKLTLWTHLMCTYTSIQCMIIVLKDTTSYRVAKRIAPSLSLLKKPSLKITNK